jgi:hypothetical protein
VYVATVAKEHGTTFFITLLANIPSVIISILFFFSIIRFAQEWVASDKSVTVFDVSALLLSEMALGPSLAVRPKSAAAHGLFA